MENIKYGRRREGRWTPVYRRKPRTPEPIPIAGKLTYSEEETHTGVEPKDYNEDDDESHVTPAISR